MDRHTSSWTTSPTPAEKEPDRLSDRAFHEHGAARDGLLLQHSLRNALAWTAEWYIREDTLREANISTVTYHHQLPMTDCAKTCGPERPTSEGPTVTAQRGRRAPRRTAAIPRKISAIGDTLSGERRARFYEQVLTAEQEGRCGCHA
ncbi:hypothetical protein [Streptomyces fractus]|uniref:hypothetical protein n=1 Tax=Streptomyces fractus TaxID=641806 RepID=UPI003CF4FA5C